MPLQTQMGVVNEATYGTPVTVTRFVEFDSEGIKPEMSVIEPKVARTITRLPRYDRFVRGIYGHAGPIKFPVMTKGFGIWLTHMTGSTPTTTGPTDSTYSHVADVGSLCGDSFTLQVNRPYGVCALVDTPFTYAGGKLADWQLSCTNGDDGVVMFEGNALFASGESSTALASASYAAGMEFLPWGASDVVVGGIALPVYNWSVKCDNGLKADRKMLRNSWARREPVENTLRTITVEFEIDLEAYVDGTPASTVGFLRKAMQTNGQAAIATDAYETVVITSRGPTLAGATTYPSLAISMGAVRFDDPWNNVDGPEASTLKVTGKALVPASGDQCKLTYITTDTLP